MLLMTLPREVVPTKKQKEKEKLKEKNKIKEKLKEKNKIKEKLKERESLFKEDKSNNY